jgi:hypothetical protein
MSKMKVEVEVNLPTEIWEARVVLPNQPMCRGNRTSNFFYNEEDARKFIIKECKRIETNILNKFDFGVYDVTFGSIFSDYGYRFQMRDKNGTMVAELYGYLYRQSIG